MRRSNRAGVHLARWLAGASQPGRQAGRPSRAAGKQGGKHVSTSCSNAWQHSVNQPLQQTSPVPFLYAILQACDVYVARSLQAERGNLGAGWLRWLLLADRLRLNRTAARCAVPLVHNLLIADSSKAREGMAQLRQLGQPSCSMLFAVLLTAARAANTQRQVTPYLPSRGDVNWRAPENLF